MKRSPSPSPLSLAVAGAALCALLAGPEATAGGFPNPVPADCGFVSDPASDSGGVTHLTSGHYGEVLPAGDVTVSPPLPSFGLCEPKFEYPRLTEVRVTDPNGQPVASTFERGNRGQLLLHFTASLPGAYPVTEVYTPDAATGRSNTELHAVVHVSRDRRDVGVVTFPRDCAQLNRTKLGTWLCDDYVIRNGVVTERLERFWVYTASDDSFWGASPNGDDVVRWVDTGSGPLTRVNIQYTGSSGPLTVTSLLASGDEVLVRLYNRLDRYVAPLSGGAPARVSTTPLQSGSAMARRGDQLLLEQSAYDSGNYLQTSTCAYRLDPAGLTATGTSCVSGYTSGMSPDGVWYSRVDSLSAYGPVDGKPTLLGTVYGPGDPSTMYGGVTGSPVFLYNPPDPVYHPSYVLFPVLQGDGTGIAELFNLPGTIEGAHGDFAWARVTDASGVPHSVAVSR